MSKLFKSEKGKIYNWVDKEIIKNNFSRYARYYDKYCAVQNLCAATLVDKLKENGFKKILDIGCGTGNYTKLLTERFSKAQITAIDISGEMLEIAKEKLKDKEIEFIVADAEKINFKERFDLISSNACFQWFENLEKALLNYKEALRENGIILFSIFGPLTFYELNESLQDLSKEDMQIASSNFIKKENITKMLASSFKDVIVEGKIYKEKYASLTDLLKKIKYTGTRGNGIEKKTFWTQKTICELEKIYAERFHGIVATYEVFFCRGLV